MPASLSEALERLSYTAGRYHDSYIVNDPRYEYFWGPGDSGAVAFARRGRYCFGVGGLLAEAGQEAPLLASFADFGQERGWHLALFNVGEEALRPFRALGWQVTKFGEDPLLDLTAHGWDGSGYEWVRRQASFCKRHGLVVSETTAEAVWDEIMDVSRLHLGMRPQRGTESVFEGVLTTAASFGRRRLLIARAGVAGRIEAFLALTPYRDGLGWGCEMYRRRPDSVRGVVPFLMVEAIDRLRAEGKAEVSLCLVPTKGADQPLPGDSVLCRRLLTAWARYGNAFFNIRGQAHFKSRFRPRFESRYLCVYPKITWGSLPPFLNAAGIL